MCVTILSLLRLAYKVSALCGKVGGHSKGTETTLRLYVPLTVKYHLTLLLNMVAANCGNFNGELVLFCVCGTFMLWQSKDHFLVCSYEVLKYVHTHTHTLMSYKCWSKS